jgi:lipooligosaccharide transport system permease protein
VYFPIEALPPWLQAVAWVLPLTAVNSLVRTCTLGFPFDPAAIPLILLWLSVLLVLSRRWMTRRLVK